MWLTGFVSLNTVMKWVIFKILFLFFRKHFNFSILAGSIISFTFSHPWLSTASSPVRPSGKNSFRFWELTCTYVVAELGKCCFSRPCRGSVSVGFSFVRISSPNLSSRNGARNGGSRRRQWLWRWRRPRSPGEKSSYIPPPSIALGIVRLFCIFFAFRAFESYRRNQRSFRLGMRLPNKLSFSWSKAKKEAFSKELKEKDGEKGVCVIRFIPSRFKRSFAMTDVSSEQVEQEPRRPRQRRKRDRFPVNVVRFISPFFKPSSQQTPSLYYESNNSLLVSLFFEEEQK